MDAEGRFVIAAPAIKFLVSPPDVNLQAASSANPAPGKHVRPSAPPPKAPGKQPQMQPQPQPQSQPQPKPRSQPQRRDPNGYTFNSRLLIA